MTGRWRLVVLVLFAVGIGWAPAAATVYLPTELGELARASQTIVRGVVVDVTADRTDVRGRISSVVTLQAEAYVKGNLGRQIQIRVPGGRVGRYENVVLGAPRLLVGQRVIVFLDARPPQLPHLVGLEQGVFRILDGPDGPYVTPPVVSAATALTANRSRSGTPPSPVRIVRGDGTRRVERLGAFEQRVATLAAGGR